MTKEQQLLLLLEQLMPLMQRLKLWQAHPPEEKALQSAEPFALDTLTPEQWLQWIFLPKMSALIGQDMPFPTGFSITPYFEECWKEQGEYVPLIILLKSIDEVCA
ncbi:YqcC family protein [Vibrio japonicus]|uniref:YqcC family protein n=1 Tax=Vibrio japonicus TaxID=1824638 RepID=A0ABY5LFP7_9VIBR|nr:YqcC family protein [Vibrio japonicus]UUM29892.1 YqcC family protein [Vibrio japonicus]